MVTDDTGSPMAVTGMLVPSRAAEQSASAITTVEPGAGCTRGSCDDSACEHMSAADAAMAKRNLR
jgi:hypothetical protein